jgi:hypothetical protein
VETLAQWRRLPGVGHGDPMDAKAETTGRRLRWPGRRPWRPRGCEGGDHWAEVAMAEAEAMAASWMRRRRLRNGGHGDLDEECTTEVPTMARPPLREWASHGPALWAQEAKAVRQGEDKNARQGSTQK